MIGEGISNPWSSQFPWVMMSATEGTFPYCKYCETFVEPLQAHLEQHQESEKHLENEKNKNIVRIVFSDPDVSLESTIIKYYSDRISFLYDLINSTLPVLSV